MLRVVRILLFVGISGFATVAAAGTELTVPIRLYALALGCFCGIAWVYAMENWRDWK